MANIITSQVGDEIEQTWMFDYFTEKTLNRKPYSCLTFKSIPCKIMTRGVLIVEKCVYAYVEVDGRDYYKGTHCWVSDIAIDDESWYGDDDPFDYEDIPLDKVLPYGRDEGGGDAGSSPTVPDSVKYSFSTKIIKDLTRLNQSQKDSLENAIQQMKNKLCYGEAVYEYLVRNNIFYDSVSINPQMLGEASCGIYPETGKVSLKFKSSENMTYVDYNHEQIHLLQHSLGSYSLDNRGMMEYERALIDDLMFYAKFKGKNSEITFDDWREKQPLIGSDLTSENTDYLKLKDLVKEYKEWLIKMTKEGIPSLVSKEDFDRWKNLYSKTIISYSPERGYKYNIEYSPKALQTVLNLSGNHCK